MKFMWATLPSWTPICPWICQTTLLQCITTLHPLGSSKVSSLLVFSCWVKLKTRKQKSPQLISGRVGLEPITAISGCCPLPGPIPQTPALWHEWQWMASLLGGDPWSWGIAALPSSLGSSSQSHIGDPFSEGLLVADSNSYTVKERKDFNHLHVTDGKIEAQKKRKDGTVYWADLMCQTSLRMLSQVTTLSVKGRKDVWLVQGHLAAKGLIQIHSGLLCFPRTRQSSPRLSPYHLRSMSVQCERSVLHGLIHCILSTTLNGCWGNGSTIIPLTLEVRKGKQRSEVSCLISHDQWGQRLRFKSRHGVQNLCTRRPPPIHRLSLNIC